MKRCSRFILLLSLFAVIMGLPDQTNAQDNYIGEIRMFAGDFAPQGWAKCEGQLLSINQNVFLFSLLGTTYGGDGVTTFALPDLRGRIPMGTGQGPGLTSTYLAEQQGTESTILLPENLPPHNHQINVYNGSGNLDSLSDNTAFPSLAQNPDLSRSNAFTSNTPNATLNPATVSNTGASTPIPLKQPSLSLTFIIALEGIFPSP